MAHVARRIRIPLVHGIDKLFEVIDQEQQNITMVMGWEHEELGRLPKPYDVRIGIVETRHSERDFFVLEDNGKLNVEVIVFEDEKEKGLYLQDFRQVRIEPLEFPKIRNKYDWE